MISRVQWSRDKFGSITVRFILSFNLYINGFSLVCKSHSRDQEEKGSARYLQGTSMVQPTRRPCGNPWSEEIYGGLGEKVASLLIRNAR